MSYTDYDFPHTSMYRSDLREILARLMELTTKLNNFISLNTIKYANPIQWNITTQYEANTVVVDANEGTAYLSIQPVPSGVSLTNTDYWTPIFNLNILSANQNISERDDGTNILATFASTTDDWLIWNSILYKVTQDIAVNEAYVVGYNLTKYTVEMFLNDAISAINTNIEDFETEINKQMSDFEEEITTILGSVVYIATNYNISPENTDNTSAFQNLINIASEHNGCIVFPGGKYNFSGTVQIYKNIRVIGLGQVVFDYSDSNTNEPLITILNDRLQTDFDIHYEQGNSYVLFENITFVGCLPDTFPTIPTTFNGRLFEFQCPYVTIKSCNIKSFNYALTFASNSYCITFDGCSIMYNNYAYYFDYSNITNAGENMLFTKCTIGNNLVAFHNNRSHLFVSHCSIDYNKVIAQSQHGTGFNLTCFDRFDGCYFEDANDSSFSELRFKDLSSNRTFRSFVNCSFFSMHQPVYQLGNLRTKVQMTNCNFYNMPSGDNKFFDYADNKYGSVLIDGAMYTGISDVLFDWGAPHNIINPTYINLENNISNGTITVDSDYNVTITNTTSSARATATEKDIKIPEGAEFCILKLVNSGGSYSNVSSSAAYIRGYDKNGNQIGAATLTASFGSNGGSGVATLSLDKKMDYVQIEVTPTTGTSGASIIYSDIYAYFV